MNRLASPAKTIFELVLLAGVVALGFNYETVLDQYALATYHPSPDMAAIQSRLELTSQANKLFSRASPVIDDKVTFNSDCETTKGELELGCYYRGRMYILKIDNTSLSPEMDVVTAHELLHAAWSRMSASEQAKLSTELEAAYAGINDPDLRDRMAEYAKSEPGEQANELHSILGTEYPGLSPELEAHYKEYFTSRSLILASHEKYQAVFSTRRQELASQLATIRSLKAQLSSMNNRLDSYRASGNVSAYNALVPQQNKLVDAINSRIDTYQAGVEEYNALSQSLDSQQITDTESTVGK